MIHGRITSKGQTTIPRAIRDALGVGAGDTILYDIKDGVVTIRSLVLGDDPPDNPFALFTEWTDELDSAYDDL